MKTHSNKFARSGVSFGKVLARVGLLSLAISLLASPFAWAAPAASEGREALVDAFEAVSVRDLGGAEERVGLTLSAHVLKGSNPCMAANTRLSSVAEAVNDELHVAVQTESISPDVFCTMEYNPVFETILFEVPYVPGSAHWIVVKNFAELDSSKTFPMPEWVP